MAQGIKLSAGEYHPNDHFSRSPDDVIRVIVSQLLEQKAFGAIGFLRATSRRFYHAVKDSFDWNQLWKKHVGLGPPTSDDPLNRYCRFRSGHIDTHYLAKTEPYGIGCLLISPDGREAVSGGHGHLWDLSSRAEKCEYLFLYNVKRLCCLAFNFQSQIAILGYWASDIFIAYPPPSDLVCIPLTVHRVAFPHVALSHDGKWVIFEDRRNENVTLRLYNLESKVEAPTIELDQNLLIGLAINGDGTRVLAAQNNGVVHCLDFASSKYYQFNGECITAVSLTEDGKTALMGRSDGTTLVWDWDQEKCRFTLDYPQRFVTEVAITMDGHWAVMGYGHGKVVFWDIREKRSLIMLDANLPDENSGSIRALPIRALAISDDGSKVLAQTSDGDNCRITFWNIG